MFLFSAVEKNEVLLIFNIFIYLFIYSFFFFALLSITARDRIAKTQVMANYQELHLILNILLIFISVLIIFTHMLSYLFSSLHCFIL